MFAGIIALADVIIKAIRKRFDLKSGIIEIVLFGTLFGLGLTLLLRHLLGG